MNRKTKREQTKLLFRHAVKKMAEGKHVVSEKSPKKDLEIANDLLTELFGSGLSELQIQHVWSLCFRLYSLGHKAKD